MFTKSGKSLANRVCSTSNDQSVGWRLYVKNKDLNTAVEKDILLMSYLCFHNDNLRIGQDAVHLRTGRMTRLSRRARGALQL